ncbi:egalitarian protein homolog isoform X2 [Bradysia coprophila]|uniref:egalitarian protein homolog isoform X2 n=1 Tax=Bradysia coprophila TaxID=38358 RepID=UPI00187DB1FE|nr:egalitarian protein homolog isoform X2 [Bradysia coprophila]
MNTVKWPSFSCLMHQRLKLVRLPSFVVNINSYQASAKGYTQYNCGAEQHDCFQESKDYFKRKLLQYGVGTKVPIKSFLWNYREAPAQIRNILRPRIRELTKFLAKHPDTFKVVPDTVALVGCDDLKNVPNNIRMENLCENNCPKSSISSSMNSTTPTCASQSNKNTRVISTTAESMNLGAKGKISLIQLGTTHGEAFIFDVLTCPQMVTVGGLKPLLESDRVIKIMHDCRGDSANLFAQFRIVLRNVFDTQVAQTVLQRQEQGKQMYEMVDMSLNKLCELYNVPTNPMKDNVKKMYQTHPKYWAKRPLTSDMLLYAAADVLVLINEQLYGTIASTIKPEFKTLLSELCTERILMSVLPREVKLRIKERNAADLKKKLCMEKVVLSDQEIELLKSLDLPDDEIDKLCTLHKARNEQAKLDQDKPH